MTVIILSQRADCKTNALWQNAAVCDMIGKTNQEVDAVTIGEALEHLQHSKFRSRFHLSGKDRAYIQEKGLPVIRSHAEDFVRTRLAPAHIPNDGKQTPMRGHPVFVAQHACACCCRGCLNQWYHIPQGVELTREQQKGIVDLMMAWIRHELKNG